METTITAEQITTLFERAKQVAIAKWSREPDYIEMQEDGKFECTWTYGTYNSSEYNYKYITLEECRDAKLDVLVAERLEKERIKKETLAREQAEYERQKQERVLAEEKQQYERLKKKFETKTNGTINNNNDIQYI